MLCALNCSLPGQDVWSELGRPCSISPKVGDAMLIHSHPAAPPLSTDTVFSYFRRGVDILFHGHTQVVKKFVLHTNCPGHADFGAYIKCNFRITLPPGCLEGGGQAITADTKWDQVEVRTSLVRWSPSTHPALPPSQMRRELGWR